MTLKEAIKSSLVILKQVMEEKLNATNIEVTATPLLARDCGLWSKSVFSLFFLAVDPDGCAMSVSVVSCIVKCPGKSAARSRSAEKGWLCKERGGGAVQDLPSQGLSGCGCSQDLRLPGGAFFGPRGVQPGSFARLIPEQQFSGSVGWRSVGAEPLLTPQEPVVLAGSLFLPLALAILFFPGTCNIRRNENYTASGLAIFSLGAAPKIPWTRGAKT